MASVAQKSTKEVEQSISNSSKRTLKKSAICHSCLFSIADADGHSFQDTDDVITNETSKFAHFKSKLKLQFSFEDHLIDKSAYSFLCYWNLLLSCILKWPWRCCLLLWLLSLECDLLFSHLVFVLVALETATVEAVAAAVDVASYLVGRLFLLLWLKLPLPSKHSSSGATLLLLNSQR